MISLSLNFTTIKTPHKLRLTAALCSNQGKLLRRIGAFVLIMAIAVILFVAIMNKYYCPTKYDHFSETTDLQRVTADLSAISNAVEMFVVQSGRYPTTLEGLEVLVSNTSDEISNWKQFLSIVPKDSWGRQFVYTLRVQHGQRYLLYSKGPDGVDNNGYYDDVVNWDKSYVCNLY